MDLKALLPVLLPKAIAWCESVSANIQAQGDALSETAMADARAVGVQHPGRVRIQFVEAFPMPNDPMLARAARAVDFLGPSTAGLTLGYGILVKRASFSRRLLSHECRHVAQFEQAGSLRGFLEAYLTELVASGYEACSFERDAREHELLAR